LKVTDPAEAVALDGVTDHSFSSTAIPPAALDGAAEADGDGVAAVPQATRVMVSAVKTAAIANPLILMVRPSKHALRQAPSVPPERVLLFGTLDCLVGPFGS
jgi:hypothetical protein